MAIEQQKTTPAGFSVDNRYPDLPPLSSLSSEDKIALGSWWFKFQQVLQRQFNQVTAEIDKKANAP